MSGLPFKPVTLTYNGEDFEVTADRVWGLIGTIEEVISRNKLVIALHNQDVPITKVATAFAAALNYAGAKNVKPYNVSIGASPDQLYLHAFALFEILNLCVQPEGFGQGANEGEPAPGEPASPAKKKAHAKQHTKSGRVGG